MRQSENKRKENAFIAGVGSITGLLKQIHDETVSGNDILKSIETHVDESINYTQLSLTGILNNQVLHTSLTYKTNVILGQINYGVQNILGYLTELFNGETFKKAKPKEIITPNITEQIIDLNPVILELKDIKNILQRLFANKSYINPGEKTTSTNNSFDLGNINFDKINNSIANVLNSSFVTDNLLTIFEKIHITLFETNNLILQLIDSVRSIYLYLPNLKNDGKSELENTVKSKSNEFVQLVKSLTGFKKILNKKFINDFETFINLYFKFIDEKNTKKLMFISTNLKLFSFVLRLVGETLDTVKSMFNGLTTSIWLLTITLLLPPFQMGTLYLIGMLKTVKSIFGSSKDTVSMVLAMKKLSLSIVMMAGATYLLGKVPFGNLFKLVVFLTLLAGALKLFQKKTEPIQTKNINISKKFGISGIFGAAVGIAILVFSIDMASQTDYRKSAALITFIAGLATTLFIFNKKKIGKHGPLDSLMNISVGLSILLLTIDAVGEVNWSGALVILGFIVSLGIAIALANRLMGNKQGGFTGKLSLGLSARMGGMFGFAAGLAILILSVDAANELTWIGALKLITFIGAVAFVVSLPGLLSKGKMNGKPMGGMFGFAAGLAILILAVDACKEVDFTQGWKLIGLMSGVIGVLWIMKKILGTPKLITLQVISFAFALTTISAALWVISKLQLDLKQLGYFSIAVIGFTLLLKFISSNAKDIYKSTPVSLLMSINISLLIGSIYLITKLKPNYESLIFFGISTIVIVGIFYLISKLASSIIVGSLLMIPLSVNTLIFAYAIKKIGDTNTNWEAVLYFFSIIGISAFVAIGLSFMFGPISIGLGVLFLLSVSLLMNAFSIKMISEMNISETGIKAYVNSIKEITLGYFTLLPNLLMAIVAAPLIFVISTVTILTAGALSLISEIDIKTERTKSFSIGMNLMIEAYNKIGLVSAGKALVKSLLILPIVITTSLVAVVLKAISALNIPKNSMENFGIILKDFLHYTTEAINGSVDALKNVEPGLNALGKLVSVAGNLVDVVEAYANMKIGEWKVVDGKLQLVGYKKIDETMMKQVGKGIGTLLACLIEPLTIISSDSDEWNFGNGPIKNPFKGGFFGTDKNSGIKRIEKIGNAFSTLISVMKGISENQLLTAEKSTFDNFKSTFNTYIQMLIENINKISGVKTKGIDDKAEDIVDFYNTINSIQDTKSKSMSEDIHKLINELSDNVKWQNINNNLNRLDKNVKSIVSNINKLNIDKAVALERNLRLFTQARTVEGINECIEQLKELVGIVVEQQEKQTQSQNNIATTLGDWFGSNNEQKQNNVQEKETKQIELKQSDNNLDEIVNILNQALNGINQKLNGTLKVQLVNGNSINFMNN